jgi:geranylgeranyl diphosphate synthase type II
MASKKTFLYVKAMETGTSEQRRRLQGEYLAENTDPESKIRNVLEIYDQLNIKTITENLANSYLKKALDFWIGPVFRQKENRNFYR